VQGQCGWGIAADNLRAATDGDRASGDDSGSVAGVDVGGRNSSSADEDGPFADGSGIALPAVTVPVASTGVDQGVVTSVSVVPVTSVVVRVPVEVLRLR
jgi:hypothetical protein